MHDYADDIAGPTDGQFKQLNELTLNLNRAEIQKAEAEAALAKAKGEVRDISEKQLPELMETMGLKDFTTSEGLRVKLKISYHASIPKGRHSEAMRWLDEQGHGGMIKRNVTVKFTRDQEDEAHALVSELSGQFPQVDETMKVESATLKAFVREILEAGGEIDDELFGIYKRRTVQVST